MWAQVGRVLGNQWLVGIATGIIAALLVKGGSLAVSGEWWLYLWRHFVLELWPMWVGVVAVVIYGTGREIRKFYALKRWIGIDGDHLSLAAMVESVAYKKAEMLVNVHETNHHRIDHSRDQ